MTNPTFETPIPILPLRSGVLLPEGLMTLTVGRERSLNLVQTLEPGQLVGVVTQLDSKVEDPVVSDFHAVGTLARITKISKAPNGGDALRVTVEGLSRFSVTRVVGYDPYIEATGHAVLEENGASKEARVLAEELVEALTQVARPKALDDAARWAAKPGVLADKVASLLGLDATKALEILVTADVPERLKKLLAAVYEQKELGELRQKIGDDVRREFSKNQREHLLREQMKAIRRELGDDKEEEQDKLKDKLDKAGLTDEAKEVVKRELNRLEQSGGQGAEATVIRTYLEWIAALPWSNTVKTKDDIDEMSAKLDADHFGLEDVKKRILEHMAVKKLSKSERGTILCLVGPPGVGKTSLGESIAEATGRPFVRVSLGGVRDEAEIRGHRRTYVGAIPGRVLHGLRKSGAKNPVMLLDEIDKLSQQWGAAAESALLEVLDPEQNKTFTDHYLEIPFDLSQVLFLCTANTLDTLSGPLRDRLEIVELSGYTPPEKKAIAVRHLLPRRLKESGIPEGALTITDDAILEVITKYTREAGVRQLDRELSRMARHVALEVARKKGDSELQFRVDEPEVERILGKPKYRDEVRERTSVAGVATGLAWTPVGGGILFIETSRTKGKGRLEITGQLGDVMKESARAALTFVKSHADELGFSAEMMEELDLHIHVPAGAIPKDGPSAGVTIFTALASLLSGRRVRSDTAMTGECTLRGRVLPVGGIKAKVLAAHRAGITRIIVPRDNERDLDEVPIEVRESIEFILADDMRKVLEAALEPDVDAGSTEGSNTTTTTATA